MMFQSGSTVLCDAVCSVNLILLCIFDGILNNPCVHVFNIVFCILVGILVFLDFFLVARYLWLTYQMLEKHGKCPFENCYKKC